MDTIKTAEERLNDYIIKLGDSIKSSIRSSTTEKIREINFKYLEKCFFIIRDILDFESFTYEKWEHIKRLIKLSGVEMNTNVQLWLDKVDDICKDMILDSTKAYF